MQKMYVTPMSTPYVFDDRDVGKYVMFHNGTLGRIQKIGDDVLFPLIVYSAYWEAPLRFTIDGHFVHYKSSSLDIQAILEPIKD